MPQRIRERLAKHWLKMNQREKAEHMESFIHAQINQGHNRFVPLITLKIEDRYTNEPGVREAV